MARGLARLVQEGLVVRRTSAVDRRNTDLVLTRRGRHRVDRLATALEDHYRSREPLAKEVLLLLGRDPDGVSEAPSPTALEVAGRMSTAGVGARAELESAMRPFGLGTWMDSYAVVVVALHELRPSQLAHELLLTATGTSSLLDRLEGQGLVERVPGALTADRRAVVVRATARGRRASDAFVAVLHRHMPAMVDAVALTIGRA
jgi:DNA-binding MarR family transcriptional regulator